MSSEDLLNFRVTPPCSHCVVATQFPLEDLGSVTLANILSCLFFWLVGSVAREAQYVQVTVSASTLVETLLCPQ